MLKKKTKKPLVIALIPARSGSKGVKNKNIKILNGKHLIYYTISAAKKSKLINRIIVTTDSKKIKKISEMYGAEVPFLRPKKISGDRTLDYPVIEHASKNLGFFNKHSNVIIIFLRPTMPFRSHKDIDKGIKLMLKNNKITCLRSVRETLYPPQWTYKLFKGKLKPFLPQVKKYQSNHRRQDLPKTYQCDGYIDAIHSRTLFKKKKFPVKNIYIVKSITKKYVDIDTIEDFQKAQFLMKK